MRKIRRPKEDERFLKDLGQHIQKLIKRRGYGSPYEFWIQEAGDTISRASLNYLLKGEVDVKATTLRKLADLLGVSVADLLVFTK